MRDIILTIVVFGILPFAIVSPHIGLLLWSWLGYMNPHRLTWGFAYSFPYVMIAAIVTMVAAVLGREKLKFPWSSVTVVWLLLVLWMCVTTMFALMPQLAQVEWQRSMKIQIMILMTLLIMGTKERLTQLVWVMAFSIGFFGIKGGVFTAVTGGNYRVWGPPGSFVEGNNEIALALLMVVPMLRFCQLQVQSRWARHAFTAAMVLCAFSIVGSWSRGALLGGFTMCLYLWFKSRNRLAFGIPLILTAIVAVTFMPRAWTDRMGTIETYQQDQSALGRINAWWFAFHLANDRPVIGGGFQAFSDELFRKYAPNPDDVHDAHSIYFEMLGEQGYVGLGLFLTLWWLTMRAAGWVNRNVKGRPDLRWAADLVTMMQVGLVGYASGGAFLGLSYFDLPYQMMSVVVLAKVIVRRELARAAESGASTPKAPVQRRSLLRPSRPIAAPKFVPR